VNGALGTSVTMVAHASLLIRSGSVSLLTDPWSAGRIFNDSWAPLFPHVLGSEHTQGLTHLWISHEHPDHLHFPSLRGLPPETRADTVVLYQRHPQRDVVRALRGLGYAGVQELVPGQWTSLSSGVEVACFPSRRIDSALAWRADGVTVLNLNDCKLSLAELQLIKRALPSIQLLLGQYGIARWMGNAADAPTQHRYRVMERTLAYCRELHPEALALFASHAWFCHQENRHLNDWAIHPRDALAYAGQKPDLPPSVRAFLPGDQWRWNEGFSETCKLALYDAARHACERSAPIVAEPHTLASLLEAGRRFLSTLASDSPDGADEPAVPYHLHIVDLGLTLELNIRRRTLHVVPVERQACHMSVGSQALWYGFNYRWGFDTLDVSGRYELLHGGRDHPVLKYCYSVSANTGRSV
jgi:UDP-MurNAc hydroxylase